MPKNYDKQDLVMKVQMKAKDETTTTWNMSACMK